MQIKYHNYYKDVLRNICGNNEEKDFDLVLVL